MILGDKNTNYLLMNVLDKYFGNQVYPQVLKGDYDNIVANFFETGMHHVSACGGEATNVYVSQNLNGDPTRYLVESKFYAEKYLANVRNISVEKDGEFISVGQATFVKSDERTGDLLGPIKTYTGFKIDAQGEESELSYNDCLLQYDSCCRAIDQLAFKAPVSDMTK